MITTEEEVEEEVEVDIEVEEKSVIAYAITKKREALSPATKFIAVRNEES